MTTPVGELRTRNRPVRMAHLGLGAFHRSHQAWYTHAANGVDIVDEGWGIAAFTGRSPSAADALRAQDGMYALLERGAEADRVEIIDAIAEAHDGASPAWLDTIASPDVAVLTTTITEAGYGGHAPARIAAALRQRWHSSGAPIAVIACDNLPDNGSLLRERVWAAADPGSHAWMAENVSFVSSVVDRITPATTDTDIADLALASGIADASPVVAEPYSEWIIAGAFPAGRPPCQAGGAVFVDDVRPYEQRKLWLLNAGHSLLAYAGLLRGLRTVSEAYADAAIRDRLEELWAEQRAVIELEAGGIDAWLGELRTRFENPRIVHQLKQIARDGSHKLRARIVEPLERRQERGEAPGDAQLAVLADWVSVVGDFGPTDRASAALGTQHGRRTSIQRRAQVALDLLNDARPQA